MEQEILLELNHWICLYYSAVTILLMMVNTMADTKVIDGDVLESSGRIW